MVWKATVLQVRFLDWQVSHHLGTCETCELLGPAPDLPKQKPGLGASQALQVGLMQLKFENHFSRGGATSPKSSLHLIPSTEICVFVARLVWPRSASSA